MLHCAFVVFVKILHDSISEKKVVTCYAAALFCLNSDALIGGKITLADWTVRTKHGVDKMGVIIFQIHMTNAFQFSWLFFI